MAYKILQKRKKNSLVAKDEDKCMLKFKYRKHLEQDLEIYIISHYQNKKNEVNQQSKIRYAM